jgi:hydrogenase maturation protease
MGDDGAGLVALEQLREGWMLPTEVELVDGGTWGMNLLPLIEGVDQLLFLDAIHAGSTPGAIVELVGDEVPRGLGHKLSPHQIDLREVLALAMLRGTLPSTLAVIGVEPATVEMRTTLSPVVEAAIPLMVARAVSWLETCGHECTPLEPAACTS